MKPLLIAAFAVFLTASAVHAQPNVTPSPETLAAMEKLRWLEGSWSGSGSMRVGATQHTFTQEETITMKVNGSVIQIDGLGRDSQTGAVVHQAYGVISWDSVNKKYLFRAWRGDGGHVDADTKLHADGSFEWGFAIPNVGYSRYVIRQVDGEWVETGTIEMANGQTMEFLQFRLKRKAI